MEMFGAPHGGFGLVAEVPVVQPDQCIVVADINAVLGGRGTVVEVECQRHVEF